MAMQTILARMRAATGAAGAMWIALLVAALPLRYSLPFTGTAHALKSRCLPSRACPAPGRLPLITRRNSQ